MRERLHHPTLTELGRGKLRIGFFTDTYHPQVNGVAISVSLLAHQLRDMGHEVLIFAPDFVGYSERDRNVLRLPSVRYLVAPPIDIAVPGTPQATLILGQTKLDVIHSHTPLTLGLLACPMARLKRLPLVCTYHTSITDYTHYLKRVGDGRLIKQAASHFSALTCNVCDQVVVPSMKFDKLLRAQQVHRPIQTIPNGIDLARFQSREPRGAFRQKLGLGHDDLMLLSVGRLEAEKSLDSIIEAFGRIAAKRPDTWLVLAGDGSCRPTLQGLAAKSGAGDRILFPGMIDRADLPGLFHDADIYVTASTTEVHSLAMIEAIASGLPVVGVRDEALQGMVVDGVNGWNTHNEVGAFSLATTRLLSEPGTRRAFGQASKGLSENYSIQAQAATLIELYTRLIAERASTRSAGRQSWVPRWQGPGPTA